MTARAIVVTALLIASLVLASAPAGAIAAGTYSVNACSPTSSPGAWQQVDTFPTAMASGNQCGGPMIGPVGSGEAGALWGEDVVGTSAQIPNGSEAGWSFQAPAGATITAVSYYRSIATATGAADWVSGMFAQDGTELDTCETNPDPCSSPNNQVPVTLSGLSATGLFFGIKCVDTPPSTICLAGGLQHDAQADMYSIRVTLAESGMPVVSGVAGPLWGGGVASGTAPVTFSASDLSGISTVAVSGPSKQIASQPQSCNYSSTQPCPQLPTGSISVNTAALADGPQTLTLLVTNAAGNTTSVQSPPVVIDNNGPPAPTSLTAAAVGAGSDVIDLTWSNPASPPQPVTGAFAQLCQATCAAPGAVSPGGAAQLTAPAPGTYTVRLWLVDQAGRGSASNAATTAVTIPQPSAGPTGPSGPSGPSGTSGPTGATGANTGKIDPKLRITHHHLDHGRRLTLTVSVPKSVAGRVTIAVIGYHGADQSCMTTHRVKPARGHATTTFVLTTMERHAPRLVAKATASHVKTATVTIRKPRA